MKAFGSLFLLLSLLLPLATLHAQPAPTFTAGRDYFVLDQPQRTNVAPGKVEVLEVFSYGCPACNAFNPYIQQLRRMLPPTAQMSYLPAAFNKVEDWEMFQRAFCAAQILGIVDKTHDAIYD